MQIPLLGNSSAGRSWALGSRRLVNGYAVPLQDGGKGKVALHGTPGLTEWADLGSGAEVRGMLPMGDNLYAVSSDKVYKISPAGVVTTLAGSLLTASGLVSMAENRTQFMVTDRLYGYYSDGSTLTRITDADFPGGGPVTVQDQYFIVPKPGDRTWNVSNLGNAAAWDALDESVAERDSSDIMTITAVSGELYVIKETMTEIWTDTGNILFPFELRQGAEMEVGCLASRSVASLGDTLFWLGTTRQGGRGVVMVTGYTPQVISTPELDQVLTDYAMVSDARGFAYRMDGHAFYVLTFPSQAVTWVYDGTTNLWHERRSLGIGRWRANCHASFAGRELVGDYANGKIWKLDPDAFTEGGEVLEFDWLAPIVFNELRNVFHLGLLVDMETGRGMDGRTPQAVLQWSDDMGRTWSNEHWASIGTVGEYGRRVKWQRLGKSRGRIYAVRITDPVRRVITGAYLEAEGGAS